MRRTMQCDKTGDWERNGWRHGKSFGTPAIFTGAVWGRSLLLFTFCCLVTWSCSSKGSSEGGEATDFFSGELEYRDHQFSFRDCATAARYSVARTEGDGRTYDRYMQYRPEVGESLFCRVRGHFDTVYTTVPQVSFVIDRLMEFDPARSCDPGAMVVGVYESGDKAIRVVLQLYEDYRYALQYFGSEQVSRCTGSWGLAAERELVLRAPAAQLLFGEDTLSGGALRSPDLLFQLIPDQQTLALNNQAAYPLVLKKIYLQP